MIKQTALYINAADKSFKTEELTDPEIIGPVDFGFKQSKENAFTFGRGILADSLIPGTKRLIFSANSPLWGSFYISTMGGAGEIFKGLGINYVSIKGSCDNYSILKLKRVNNEITAEFEYIDIEPIWKDYDNKVGVYALQKFVFDNFSKEYQNCRILVTGPASMKTNNGAIASAPIVNNEVTYVDCWAGRGGLGSKLVQEHKIVAIIYGGDFICNNPIMKDLKYVDKVFNEKLGKNMMPEDIESTIKYRYDPVLKTGGTLGVNFTKLKDWMLSFNYDSINFTNEKRLKIHENFIVNHYLKQFNEETIETKSFKHCGEPCPAMCKKMRDEFKKDYEPYESMGPNAGIFDQRAAEKLNHYADAMGFDAIQVGSLISWIMEIISKGLIKKEDLNLTIDPKFDPDNFNIIDDSMNNADLGIEIINMILFSEKGELFRKGIRTAAKELDKKFNINSINYAVFNSFGKSGCMVPNQYWVPGMFSPMPIMGKYFEYYGSEFIPPKELGKMNVERMIKELYCDNAGVCRFHRKWVESIIHDIVKELLGEEIDYPAHHKKLSQDINWGNKPVFWESERVIDLIKVYLEKIQEGDPENEELKGWIEKFKTNKNEAAKEYWSLIKEGIYEALG